MLDDAEYVCVVMGNNLCGPPNLCSNLNVL